MNSDDTANQQLDHILNILLEYGKGNFSVRTTIPDSDDTLNAVLVGLNMLGEELEYYRQEDRRKNQLLRDVFENTDEIIYALDIEGTDLSNARFLFSSNQVSRLLGYEEEDLKKGFGVWSKAIHPQDFNTYRNHIHEALKGKAVSCDYRMRKKNNGEYIWVSDRLWSQDAGNGRTHIYGAARDITQRKNQEEYTRRTLAEIKTIDSIYQAAVKGGDTLEILHLLSDGIKKLVDVTASRVFTYNPKTDTLEMKAQRLSAKHQEGLMMFLGKVSVSSIVPIVEPGSRFHNILEKRKMVFATDPKEIIELMKDHTKVPAFRAVAAPARKLLGIKTFSVLPIANKERVFGMLTCVANRELSLPEQGLVVRLVNHAAFTLARIRADEELREQKKFSESILNTLPVDIAVFDKDHRYRFVNPKAIQNQEIRDWIIGKDDFEYVAKRGHPKSLAQKRREHFVKAVHSGKPHGWIDEYQKEDGSKQYIMRELYPYFDENNELQSVFGHGVDITSLKNAELEKEQLLKELGQRVNELMQFNSVVSHHLRAPVATLMGLCNLIEMKPSEEDVHEIMEGVKVTSEALDHVLRDLNMVLATKSNLNQRVDKIDLREIVRLVRNELELQISSANATVKLVDNPDLKPFYSISSYLQSIIYILVSNAIKYRRQDVDPVVKVVAHQKESEVEIEVIDNGLGIDLKRYGDEIFGFYKRFHNHVQGRGLGLYLAKAQVETLGGQIRVQSNLGTGSMFSIVLPNQAGEKV
ncbi:MAG TPA: hypothetical protein DCG19_00290 [Cryomorphaceae bacterium]|nr:hypothetical protein [Cryomorphaceae bacterium]